eukprot:765353-Hanusia_phi.AAC.7
MFTTIYEFVSGFNETARAPGAPGPRRPRLGLSRRFRGRPGPGQVFESYDAAPYGRRRRPRRTESVSEPPPSRLRRSPGLTEFRNRRELPSSGNLGRGRRARP